MADEMAITLDGLSKTFGRGRNAVQAVKDVRLQVPAGQVFGFLGPNGAGKTTTIRMIMDLVRPTAGRVLLYGEPVAEKRETLRRVGALVEGATFYHFMTGRENLETLALTGGYLDKERIGGLLEQVGLKERADRPVATFSTGMKQRLGVAAALLGDPELVILDEPTNGLDPAGIQEMRHFIRALVEEQGKTVFLSSHILGEVEQVCDRVAIISRGEIVRQGAVAALLGSQTAVEIEAEPLRQAAAALNERWPAQQNGRLLTVAAGREEVPALVARLVDAGVAIFGVRVVRQSLESYFLEATAGGGTKEEGR